MYTKVLSFDQAGNANVAAALEQLDGETDKLKAVALGFIDSEVAAPTGVTQDMMSAKISFLPEEMQKAAEDGEIFVKEEGSQYVVYSCGPEPEPFLEPGSASGSGSGPGSGSEPESECAEISRVDVFTPVISPKSGSTTDAPSTEAPDTIDETGMGGDTGMGSFGPNATANAIANTTANATANAATPVAAPASAPTSGTRTMAEVAAEYKTAVEDAINAGNFTVETIAAGSTAEEVLEGFQKALPVALTDLTVEQIKAFDKDGDGVFSQEEIDAAAKEFGASEAIKTVGTVGNPVSAPSTAAPDSASSDASSAVVSFAAAAIAATVAVHVVF